MSIGFGGKAMKVLVPKCLIMCLCLIASMARTPAAAAADSATGKLVVGGKSVDLTHVYAYLTKTSDGKDAVIVLLSDGLVPAEAVQNDYARKKLVDAGTLHYVELLIASGKQIHYEVQHQRFGMLMQPGGDDTEHVFVAKAGDGKTVAGRARTTEPQKSPDDVPYSYDVTFAAAVAAATPQ